MSGHGKQRGENGKTAAGGAGIEKRSNDRLTHNHLRHMETNSGMQPTRQCLPQQVIHVIFQQCNNLTGHTVQV